MEHIAITGLAMLTLASCEQNMPSAPSEPSTRNQQASSLQGTWDYQSTDGQDLSGYGITYAFNGSTWTYVLGDAGTKQYDFQIAGDSVLATLTTNQLNTSEAAGSKVAGTFRVSGDTLTMITDGHTSVLRRS